MSPPSSAIHRRQKYLLPRTESHAAAPAAHFAGALVITLSLLELCLRGVSRRSTSIDPAADLFLLGLIALRWNPVSSFFGTLTDSFGIDLRGTWSLRFIQRSLAPLALGLVRTTRDRSVSTAQQLAAQDPTAG